MRKNQITFFLKNSVLVALMQLTIVGLSPFLGIVSCTSKVNEIEEIKKEDASEVQKAGCKGKDCQVCTLPWGDILPHGQILKNVYSKELAGCDEQCDNFTLTLECESGKLWQVHRSERSEFKRSAFKSCFKKKCDCNFKSQVIPDGSEKDFFKNSVRICEDQCQKKRLKCVSGKIVDPTNLTSTTDFTLEYPNLSCEQIPCAKCTAPWGAQYVSGATFPGFKSSNVLCGRDCNSSENKVTFKCVNGEIEGIQDISLFNKETCRVNDCTPCTLPCGKTVTSGGHNTCYSTTSPTICGDTCFRNSKEFYCDDGVVTDSSGVPTPPTEVALYNHASCTNSNTACVQCKTPDGKVIDDSKKVTFYKKSLVECTESCLDPKNAVTLTCSDGQFGNKILYPDFNSTSCKSKCDGVANGNRGIGRIEGAGGGAPVSLCRLPWANQMVTHNTRIVAYSKGSVPNGSSCAPYKKIITCNAYKGLWTGGVVHIYPTCYVEK